MGFRITSTSANMGGSTAERTCTTAAFALERTTFRVLVPVCVEVEDNLRRARLVMGIMSGKGDGALPIPMSSPVFDHLGSIVAAC